VEKWNKFIRIEDRKHIKRKKKTKTNTYKKPFFSLCITILKIAIKYIPLRLKVNKRKEKENYTHKNTKNPNKSYTHKKITQQRILSIVKRRVFHSLKPL